MPLPARAPYETLATVSELARQILGDFIQGIVPNVSGTVNTDGTGLVVTWVVGNKFTALLNGVTILINGIPYTVAMVTSPTTLNLVGQAPANQAGSAYSAVIPTGDIFADQQSYVLPIINLAWHKLQEKLAHRGHPRLESEATVSSLPIVTNLDPSSQQWISWTQFFDGTNLLATPFLPNDFISPLRLEERQSAPAGVVNLNRFLPMHPAPNGLRGKPKGSWNRYFDWRADAIYFRGATALMDIHLRYAAYLPDIAVASGGFASTPIPIMRAARALAYYAAGIFVEPRGSTLKPSYDAQGDAAVDQTTNAFAKLQQRASYSRIPWGARGRRRQIR